MKNSILFILSIALQFIGSYFIDIHWTQFAVLTMSISLIGYFKFNFSKKTLYINAFFSVFTVWILFSLVANELNQSILFHRIALLFNLPNIYLLPIIQGLFGGLISLFSSFVILLFSNKVK